MFRIYTIHSHSYTHLILALSIVRKPTIWGFITSEYPGIHNIGRAMQITYPTVLKARTTADEARMMQLLEFVGIAFLVCCWVAV